jgi:uncharacterized membrane protein
MVAVLVGAAVLFGLEQGFGVKLYIAIPVAVLAYIVTLVAAGLLLGTDGRAK